MDREQRLHHLEAVRDWQGLAEELERSIAAETDAAAKVTYHLRLGRVLEDKLLHVVHALKHFQDAYKLDPARTAALRQARAIYWNLGKVHMVQKLLELELERTTDPAVKTELLLELGDVLRDTGDLEKATAAYAGALSASGGQSEEARACLADVRADEATWQERIALIDQAHGAAPEDRARLYMRAYRLARRFAPAEVERLLTLAYEADSANKQAAAAYEQLLADEDRAQVIVETQRRLLAALSGHARGAAAFRYGVRWATRHQNPETGAQLFEEALTADPDNDAAFAYLRDLWGSKQGDWKRVAQLAEKVASSKAPAPAAQTVEPRPERKMRRTNGGFALSCGRTVSLEWLRQWSVYAGLLEGLPTRSRNDAEIERLVADAHRKDGHAPVLIRPAQRPIEYDGRYPFGEPAALPAIGCIARLHSHSPARDHSKDYSALTVIWFQDDYAFPLSEEAERAIVGLDWENLACDREY